MTAKIHQLPSEGSADHEGLTLARFAKRAGITRQTAYKWAKYHREKFPKGSLYIDPQGKFGVYWDVYKKGFTVIN